MFLFCFRIWLPPNQWKLLATYVDTWHLSSTSAPASPSSTKMWVSGVVEFVSMVCVWAGPLGGRAVTQFDPRGPWKTLLHAAQSWVFVFEERGWFCVFVFIVWVTKWKPGNEDNGFVVLKIYSGSHAAINHQRVSADCQGQETSWQTLTPRASWIIPVRSESLNLFLQITPSSTCSGNWLKQLNNSRVLLS